MLLVLFLGLLIGAGAVAVLLVVLMACLPLMGLPVVGARAVLVDVLAAAAPLVVTVLAMAAPAVLALAPVRACDFVLKEAIEPLSA